MKKTNYSFLVWGILFLTMGVLWAGNIGNYWDVDIPYLLFYRGFWTLFIILPCMVSIFQNGFQVAQITAIVTSSLILLAKLDMLDLSVAKRMLLPCLLIVIGLSFFSHCFFPDREPAEEDANNINDGDCEDASYEAVFCSKAIDYDNLLFQGCSLSSTFGEVRLDLSKAEFPEQTTYITSSAILGSLDIRLPDKANVIVKGRPILGGLHNYRKGHASVEDAPTICIEITCIFGGIDIR